MKEDKLRQLFKNRSNCYAQAADVVQAMDENGFVETVKEWQSEQDNWISVEERLPDTNEAFGESAFVLGIEEEFNEPVTVWYNSRHKIWRVAHYKADNDPIDITHWQPLPPPPKVKETEK